MKNFYIVHLSDIHVSQKNVTLVDYITDALITDINKFQENHSPIDIICFSGDLVVSGEDGDNLIKIALSHFINPLLSGISVIPQRFFMCPGNHENDLSKFDIIAHSGISQQLNSSATINDLFSNKILNKYVIAPEYFITTFKQLNPDIKFLDSLTAVSQITIDENKLGLVMINTAWNSCGDSKKDCSKLFLGYPEIEKATKAINSCDFKIAIMHHPTYFINEIEKQICENLLSKYDLVLCGHLHNLKDRQILTATGNNTLYLSSGRLDTQNSELSGYSIIEINPYTREAKVNFRRFFEMRKCFDASLYNSSDGVFSYQLGKTDESLKICYEFSRNMVMPYHNFLKRKLISDVMKEKSEINFIEPILKLNSELTESTTLDTENSNIVLSDLLSDKNNYIIYGRKNFGKSSLLKYIAIQYIENFIIYHKMPLFIDINEVDFAGKNQLIRQACKSISKISEQSYCLNSSQLDKVLSHNLGVFLIDNIDFNNEKHKKILDDLYEKYPESKYILTYIEDNEILNIKEQMPVIYRSFTNIYIYSPSKRMTKTFAKEWLPENENIDQLVDKASICISEIGMAKTPLNTILVLYVFNDSNDFSAINEASVIEKFMELILEKVNFSELKLESFDFKNKEHFLCYIAYHMFSINRYFLTINEFNDLLTVYFADNGLDRKCSGFDYIFFEKKVLLKEQDIICFFYPFILEYYIAKSFIEYGIPSSLFENHNYLKYANELNYYSGLKRKCELFERINADLDAFLIDYKEKIKNSFIYSSNVEIDFSIAELFEKPSQEFLDEITDKPDNGENYTPNQYAKEKAELSKENNTTSEDNDFIATLILFCKIIRNSEYLHPNLKIASIKKCIYGCCAILSLFMEKFEEFTTNDLPAYAEKAKKVGISKETVLYIIEVIKLAIPSVIEEIVIHNALGSKKLLPQFIEIIDSRELEEIPELFILMVLLDMDEGYNTVNQIIRQTTSQNLLSLLFIKIINLYLFTSSPSTEYRLGGLINTLIKHQKPVKAQNKIMRLDSQSILKTIKEKKRSLN